MAASVDITSPAIPTSFITLSSKPAAKLSYSFIPAASSQGHQPLIVFINGLGLTASSWIPTIASLASMPSHPAMLSYDRYGQGLSTDRDPLDAKNPEHMHDCMDVVRDLRQLISQICHEKGLHVPAASSESDSEAAEPPLFFVTNSLGCAVARLYADLYPYTVSTILFLDSVIANTDFVSIWPDPDAPGFGEKYLPLPEGVTEAGLRETRAKFRHVFHPVTGIMGKAEGLSRANLPDLLPRPDEPVLRFGKDGEGPWITVVGHGFDTFAEEGLKGMGIAIAMTQRYMNPYWYQYNEGLTKLTSPGRSRGPIAAEKCGHFIQRDDPDLVVQEITEILSKQGLP